MKYKNLALIILNYNDYNSTINAVKNFLSFNFCSTILIVDNASSNNSLSILKNQFINEANVHIIENKQNTGYANGNNIGLKEAAKIIPDVKYVIIMNPDVMIPNAQTIDILYNALESNPDIAVVTAITKYDDIINNPNKCAWSYPSKKKLFFEKTYLGRLIHLENNFLDITNSANIEYVDVVQGCFFMANYNTLNSVNFFDKGTFLYYEEDILSKKLDKLGKKKAVATDAIIHHNHIVKSKETENRKIKYFYDDCNRDSKIFYINKYSGYSKTYCILTTIFLKIDKLLKHVIHMLLLLKK